MTPQTKAEDVLERMKQYISEDFDPVASAIFADAIEEIRTLRALAEKLPMTRDGVPIVPGMVIYWNAPVGIVEAVVWYVGEDGNISTSCMNGGAPNDCYSTRELAAAAPPTAPNGGGVD